MNYPVDLTPDDDTIMARFADFPGATFGDDDADALARAVSLLETILASYIDDRRDLPSPSPARGRPMVEPTLLGAMKVAVYQAMRARGWRKADLARALHVDPRQVDRLLDLRHGSPVAQIEAALAACGQTVRVELAELAA